MNKPYGMQDLYLNTLSLFFSSSTIGKPTSLPDRNECAGWRDAQFYPCFRSHAFKSEPLAWLFAAVVTPAYCRGDIPTHAPAMRRTEGTCRRRLTPRVRGADRRSAIDDSLCHRRTMRKEDFLSNNYLTKSCHAHVTAWINSSSSLWGLSAIFSIILACPAALYWFATKHYLNLAVVSPMFHVLADMYIWPPIDVCLRELSCWLDQGSRDHGVVEKADGWTDQRLTFWLGSLHSLSHFPLTCNVRPVKL